VGVAVEARHLEKNYGEFVAVGGVSFTIPRGQVVALLGPNGAGKTTTMKMLTGYIAPSSGTARICGHDVQTERLAAAARVGYLPENGPLYPDMTPAGLLEFFGRARGLTSPDRAARTRDVVSQLELEHLLEKPIDKLSKGLRQRVALAQALLHDPDVLIMDEPTAGLDPNQIRQFRALVGHLRGRKTLLISTHILQEVEALAERVLLMHGGNLVFDGTPGDMSRFGPLEEAFHALTQGGRVTARSAGIAGSDADARQDRR
jgi:ABC-2 type transport system ATP-binding protein